MGEEAKEGIEEAPLDRKERDPFEGCPPRPDPPFLPPRHACTKEYTLVLDLDETLIHYDDVSNFPHSLLD